MADMTTNDPIFAAVRQAEKLISDHFEATYPKGPKWFTVRAVCRDLCKRAGYDPDRIVMGGEGYVLGQGPNGTVHMQIPMAPAWASYIGQVLPVFQAGERLGFFKWPG